MPGPAPSKLTSTREHRHAPTLRSNAAVSLSNRSSDLSRQVLSVDQEQLAAFIGVMFRDADTGTYASIRAFPEVEGTPSIQSVKLNGDPNKLVKAATRQAQAAADRAEPWVFAPPIATFTNPDKAREVDLACGLAVSVELDRNPGSGLKRLEELLGPATAVVASGGTWVDPATGEVQDKLHVHWRLAEPTRDPEAHSRLKQARTAATQLVGGDCTNKPIVHPIRWPGSWHRKGEPRLCRTVSLNPDADIDLEVVLEALREACPEPSGEGGAARAEGGHSDGDRPTEELVRRITTGEEYHAALRDLAFRYVKAGMPGGLVVATLYGFMAGSLAPHDERWAHRRSQIPELVRTAWEKIHGPESKDWMDDILGEPPEAANDNRPNAEKEQRFKFVSVEDDAELLLESGLVDGLLDRVALSEIFGPSGSGRTFVALDLACHISLGMDWNGLKVEQGTVVYLAAENPDSVRKRAWAWRKFHGKLAEPMPLHILVNSLNLSSRNARGDYVGDAQELAAQIMEMGIEPRLFVVDTLARSMRDDENSNDAMGAYVRQCELLRDQFKAHVLIVHHTGKDPTRGARGGSALRAAIDTEIEVKKERGKAVGHFEITKTRDGEFEGRKFGFELKRFELGRNDKDRLVTTCIAIPAAVPKEKATGAKVTLGPNATIVLRTFNKNAVDGRLPLQKLRELAEKQLSSRRNSQDFNRALTQLVAKEQLFHDSKTAMNWVAWVSEVED